MASKHMEKEEIKEKRDIPNKVKKIHQFDHGEDEEDREDSDFEEFLNQLGIKQPK